MESCKHADHFPVRHVTASTVLGAWVMAIRGNIVRASVTCREVQVSNLINPLILNNPCHTNSMYLRYLPSDAEIVHLFHENPSS